MMVEETKSGADDWSTVDVDIHSRGFGGKGVFVCVCVCVWGGIMASELTEV